MKGLKVLLFVLVFLLIAAAVFMVLTRLDGMMNSSEPAAPVDDPVIVPPAPTAQAPVTTPFAAPATPVPTPVPTPVVTPQPYTPQAPQPTPTPLPTTVPTSVPYRTNLSSGSFRSDTGTYLNITANWSAQSLDQSRIEVTVSVSAESYALQVDGWPKTLNLSLDGQYVSLDSPAIHYEGSSQITTALGTHTFTVDLPSNSSRTLALQVEWQYNGSYSGVQLPVIECGGNISISR